MVNLLPAVLVGGPPHAGKSVLTYNLTRELRRRKIEHYVLRANPDGEGDWTQETPLDTIRQLPPTKLGWTDDFITLVCRDLERRPLPLLVDLGGLPTEKEYAIFRACTHSLLLLRADKEENARYWRRLVAAHGLVPLADLSSELPGLTQLSSTTPVITGTLAGLEQRTIIQGSVFDALVDRLSMLFSSYTESNLKMLHFGTAPIDTIIDFPVLLDTLAPGEHDWKATLLPRLLDELPRQKQLALYGRGPNWLYATTAAVNNLPLYQFDAHIGWITPPVLQIALEIPDVPIHVDLQLHDKVSVLEMYLTKNYLDFLEADALRFPPVPNDKGLLLSGKLPFWLYTALVRLYQSMNVPWIACYQPQLQGAAVVVSQTSLHSIGEVVPLPPCSS